MANDSEDFFDAFKNKPVTKVEKFSFKKVERNNSKQSIPETVSRFFKPAEKKETPKVHDSIEDELEAIFNEPSAIKQGVTARNLNSTIGSTNNSNFNKALSPVISSNSVNPKFNFKSTSNGISKNVSTFNNTATIESAKGAPNKTVSLNGVKPKFNLTNISNTKQAIHKRVVVTSTATSPKLNFKNVRTSSSDDFEITAPAQKTSSEKSSSLAKNNSEVTRLKNSGKFQFKKKPVTNVSSAVFKSLFGDTFSTDKIQRTEKIMENKAECCKQGTFLNNASDAQNIKNLVESTNSDISTKETDSITETINSYNLNSSGSSTDSPVIKQKKLLLKTPLKSDSSTSGSPSLLSLKTSNDTLNNLKRHSIISISSTENSPIIQQPKLLNKNIRLDEQKRKNSKNMALDDEVNFISKSLAASEEDYMDDETFEKMFCEKTEKSKDEIDDIDLSTIDWEEDFSENITNAAASTSKNKTENYMEEVSGINWNEDVFDEETVPLSFKDRDDNSTEFHKRYHFSEVMEEVLHQKFGLETFRPQQREIINATLNRHDCFVLMPTGGGKSLCYQLPAVLSEGVSVVISPLRALIGDQVDKMNGLDIAAAHLCQDVGKDETSRILAKLHCREPLIKLLYLTPEKIMASRVASDMLKTLYQRGKLARFVIDEAHCLSQWGHDFRPDYKQLSFLKNEFKDVPIMCLTATATKQVESDVIAILKLKNVKRFIMSFNRPNIKYQVIPKKGKFASEEITGLIKKKFLRKSGIIYCLARNDCETLADTLNSAGIKTRPYHAGMGDKIREAIQREWMQDRFFVIVATIAFGMGIDKPDVRFVIHNSIPKSVEAFYQESGRAGRDGDISYSYLFYNYNDVVRLQKLMQLERKHSRVLEGHRNNLNQMVSFAENVVDCRRYLQLIHLGENFNRQLCIRNKATTCDNCENINTYSTIEVTKEARELGTLVQDLTARSNVTLLHVGEVYKGSKIKKILNMGHDKHRFYGGGSSMNKTDIHRILKDMVLKNVLEDHVIYTGEFPIVYIKAGKKFDALNAPNLKITIPVNKQSAKKIINTSITEDEMETVDVRDVPGPSKPLPVTTNKTKSAAYAKFNKTKITNLKVQCHEALLEECRKMALERNLTLSSIMNLTAIKTMSDVLPKNKEEFLKIQHVTAANFKKCGDNFLAITTKFREQVDALETASKISEKSSFGDSYANEDDWCSSQSSSSRGTKRKWTGRARKKTKSIRRRAPKSPSKRKTTGYKKGGWGGGKGGKGGKRGGSGGIGLMPVHFS